MKRAEDSTSPASSGTFGVEAKHAVLDYYYDNVVSLHSYQQACLPSELAYQLLDTVIDRASYTTLLQHTYVAYSGPEGHPRHLQDAPQDSLALEDVVRRVQREVLSSSGKADNILCHGYVMVSPVRIWLKYTTKPTTLQSFQKGSSIVNRYSNSTLTELQESADWKLLFQRLDYMCTSYS